MPKIKLAVLLPLFLYSNPTGEHLISGTVELMREGPLLHIHQTSDQAILEWDHFSIDALETTQFIQPSSTASLLNRVTGPLPSTIEGTLKANGTIYLINPQGLILGGRIDTAHFVASTFDIPNIDFLEGRLQFQGHSEALISHTGLLEAHSVLFAAHQIREGGLIRAPSGTIKLLVTAHLEQVYLVEPSLELSETATLDVSGKHGGEIELRSQGTLAVAHGAHLAADGIEEAAGSLFLFADGSLQFHGEISAQGLGQRGDGGEVEISSNHALQITGHADLRAQHGKTGLLILDPGSVTIEHSTSSESGLNTFSDAYINTQLATSSLTITTASGTNSGTETLTFNNSNGDVVISWSTATTFTAIGRRNLIMQDGTSITSSYSGTNFDALILQGNTTSNTGNFHGIEIDADCTFSTVSGNMTLTGIGGTTAANDLAGVYIVGSSSSTGGTSFSSTGSGAITLSGTGKALNSGYGIYFSNAAISSSSSGAITLTGSYSGATGSACYGIYFLGAAVGNSLIATGSGAITLTGTGGNGSGDCVGIKLVYSTTPTNEILISSNSGNITLTGTGGTNSSGFSNDGINLSSEVAISTTSGTMTLTGSSGTNGFALGVSSLHRLITASGTIVVTGTSSASTDGDGVLIKSALATGTGSISITGTNSTSGSAAAIALRDGSILSTTSGALTLTATGSSTIGLEILADAFLSTNSGTISITGSGSGGGIVGDSGSNFTVFVSDSDASVSFITDSISISTCTVMGSGTATIVPFTSGASMGLGSSASGTVSLSSSVLSIFQSSLASVTFGSSTTGAMTMSAQAYTYPTIVEGSSVTVSGAISFTNQDITFITDAITLSASVTGSGDLVFQPLTNSTSIGLGSSASGTLSFTDTELGYLTNGFSSITFGSSSSTGTVTLSAYTYSDPLILYGQTITVSGAISAGANNITCYVGPASAGTLNLNALLTTTGTCSIQGGSYNDQFNISVSGQTATLNGNSGTNTLVGPSATNLWYVTGSNQGNLVSGGSTLSFSHIANLTGGSLGDQFIFSDQQGVTGLIDGGASLALNILDYSLFSKPAVIIMTTTSSGTASNLGGGFQNIGSIIGAFTVAACTDQIVELITYPFYYNQLWLLTATDYHYLRSSLNRPYFITPFFSGPQSPQSALLLKTPV